MISRCCLLAVLVLGLGPCVGLAESIVIRNDTTAPMIVQASCVVKGALVRDKPILLKPGESSPAINLPGNKVIAIFDGSAPNRQLYQTGIAAGTEDLYLGITPAGRSVTLEQRKPR